MGCIFLSSEGLKVSLRYIDFSKIVLKHAGIYAFHKIGDTPW